MRVSYEKAALIFRAMHGDEHARSIVTVDEIRQFSHADKFHNFLEINEDHQYYDEVIR